MTEDEMRKKIAIAAAGIDRFYDEGYTKWPEDRFRVLFTGSALEEKAIQEALRTWEASGAIIRRNQPTCFVEVLRPVGSIRM